MHKNLPIISLPKEEWEGTIIPIQYTTEEYFDVEIIKSSQGYHMDMHKKKFDAPVSHYPEEYDFPDKLYQPHWERACAWGIVDTEGGERRLLARRDCLKGRLSVLRGFLGNASALVRRHSVSEIKVKSTVDVRKLQKQVDALSKELRQLEETIQEKNWTTELI